MKRREFITLLGGATIEIRRIEIEFLHAHDCPM
jgi:hypothetical protein